MKSIAIVIPELLPVPPERGGAVEHWVHEASQYLARDFSVTIYSRPASSSSPHPIRNIFIPWTPFEIWFQRLKDKLTWKNPLRYLAKLQNVWSYGRRVAKSIRSNQQDVIYVHNEPNLLLFIGKRVGQRIVLHMHNDHLTIRVFRMLYRRQLKKVDKVIFVSEYLRRQASNVFPEYTSRFAVIPNATDPDLFKPEPQAKNQLEQVVRFDEGYQYILYVGRLVEIKGVHTLISAFNLALEQNPNIKLIITGSSFFEGANVTPYEKELMESARSVQSAIQFTGYLPHAVLRLLYSAVEISVAPSIWQEPAGLVVIEAMASETCVIATNVGGIPETLTPDTGVLVPANDAQALADAIVSTLENQSSRLSMAKAARQRVLKHFTWPTLIESLTPNLHDTP